ncbi:NTP transferase domain-containing protein [Nesterenkonia aurantiaca]|uniref:NTP transferase domain-containing protein n=1 Tax=Nesterenkonia aurantiaca TaxID=1436010 RepID=UPI003EE4B865
MPPRTELRPGAAAAAGAAISAILLAGGRGSRLGGVDKALLRRGAQTQIERWIQELQGRDIATVVVGPPALEPLIPGSVPLVREAPGFAGPAAGVLAGAAALQRLGRDPESVGSAGSAKSEGAGAAPTRWTLLLAVDLTEPAALLDWLLGELEKPDVEKPHSEKLHVDAPIAVLPRDASGRQQYLSSAVPTDWLLGRVAALSPSEVEDRPLRWLLQGLEEAATLRRPVAPPEVSEDVDTLHDAQRLGMRLP